MGFGKIQNIILMLGISIIATIFVVFERFYFIKEMIIICLITIASVIAIYQAYEKKISSQPLLLIIFSILIINSIYLGITRSLSVILVLAFVSALVGFLITLSVEFLRKKRMVPKKRMPSKEEIEQLQKVSREMEQLTLAAKRQEARTKKVKKKPAKKKTTKKK